MKRKRSLLFSFILLCLSTPSHTYDINAASCSRTDVRRAVWLLLAIIAFLLGPNARAATISAATCSHTDIQTAIGTAVDGDTVSVPAGSCTWTSSVKIPNTKGITLQGAGSSQTIITLISQRIELTTSLVRLPIRITGFKFIKTDKISAIRIMGTAQNWRIDNNIFDGGGVTIGQIIEIGNGTPNVDAFTYGLIDHNTFTDYGIRCIFVQWNRKFGGLDGTTAGNWMWGQPAQRGTEQAVYVEDNVFVNTNGQSGQTMDGRWGAKYVFRYNTVHNAWISTHSGCTNHGRSPIWVEIYRNTTTSDGSRPFRAIELRSVSGVIWNNDIGNDHPVAIGLDFERSWRTNCGSLTIFNQKCDGTRLFDENTSGQSGWRCLGQPGWGQPQVDDMSAYTFQGVFSWDNLKGGSQASLSLQNTSRLPAPNFSTTHMVAGREFFNEANMTVGLIANRPATCSPGPENRDVYVSTNENTQGATLYICSAIDSWTKHWEPFEYPHPLTSGAVPRPASPTNLGATVK